MRSLKRVLSVVVMVLVASTAYAQTTVRWYLIPKDGTGKDHATRYQPKYLVFRNGVFQVPALAGVSWVSWDYGRAPVFLVCAAVTSAQHTTIGGNADVFSVQAALDTQVGNGSTLNTVRNRLNALKIGGSWITAGTTWRQIVRYLVLVMESAQVFERGNKGKALFADSLTDAQASQLANEAQQAAKPLPCGA